MKNNAVQNKNTLSSAYYLPGFFEHIFPAILKTVIQTKASVTNS